MNFELNLDLNPILINSIQELGKSDSVESNLINILIEFLTLKIQELNRKILKTQDKYIEKKLDNNELNLEKFDYKSLPLTITQEKFIKERDLFIQLLNDLKKYNQGKFTKDDFSRYKNKFLNRKKRNKKEINKEIQKILKNELLEEEIKSQGKEFDIEDFSKWTVEELKEFCDINNISLPYKIRKNEIINMIRENRDNLRPLTPRGKIMPVITTERVLEALSNKWQPIKSLIFKLEIKDMMDARFLQIKLMQLERKGKILTKIINGKKSWKFS